MKNIITRTAEQAAQQGFILVRDGQSQIEAEFYQDRCRRAEPFVSGKVKRGRVRLMVDYPACRLLLGTVRNSERQALVDFLKAHGCEDGGSGNPLDLPGIDCPVAQAETVAWFLVSTARRLAAERGVAVGIEQS